MRPTSPVPIYVGIGVTVVGFLLIVFAWSRVAGEEVVPFQLPYFVSGGLTGIGLILVGLTVVAIQSRRIEGTERARQIEQVAASVTALREALVPTDDDLLSVAGADAADGQWERA
jgi:pilus assembly protein TadC